MEHRELQGEPTVRLIQRIVNASDKSALMVLLETRRLFWIKDESPLLLPEFLSILRAKELKFSARIDLADCAYDLTLAKYSNFPDMIEKEETKNYRIKGANTDCRKYYRAFLRAIGRGRNLGGVRSRFQEEVDAGRLLKKLVRKNFLRSKQECERDTPFAVRYTLTNGSGKKIYLWYPSYMAVNKFKFWLKETTERISVNAPNAQEKIQNLIERDLGRGYHISFDEMGADRMQNEADTSSAIEAKEGYVFVRKLAEAVAEEKSERVATLRPAIGKLGKDGVKELVLQIFSEIDREDYQVSRLAGQYGISKAALSRFAGSAWSGRAEVDDSVEIPDLWKNTAQILAAEPIFMETVASTGFSGTLEWVLSHIGEKEGGGHG